MLQYVICFSITCTKKFQKKFLQKLARIKYMPYVCIVKRAY